MSQDNPGDPLFPVGSLPMSLHEAEALSRVYVEAANDMVYTVDLAGCLTFMNPYGQRLVGCAPAEIVGRPYLDFVAPAFREKTALAFRNLLQTGELRDFEFMLQPFVGPPICMEVNGRLLYRNGELIGGIGIARDITERKRVEQQLQMFSKAVESAYDSAIITDLQGQILYANPAASRIFQYRLDTLKGKNASIFYLGIEQIEWLIQQAIAGGWSGEVICQRQPGERFPALVSVGLICDDKGKPTAISVISRDITQQKQIQAELAAKNIELERANRLKSEFLANMSHELRTPLTSILGFSSLLSQQIFGDLNSKQLLYTQQIHQSGQHLLSLINDVLDLSKVEAGQMLLDVTEISVMELCEDVLALVSAQAEARQLTLHQEIEPNLPSLMADELRVRQMLLNLLSNAIKFSYEKGNIGLEAKAQAGYLYFTVWDQGIGIAESKHKLLFQPFQQVDGSLARRHEGTGLGLALTRRLAELHHGTVEFESKEKEGSRFTIRLPCNLHSNIVDLALEAEPAFVPSLQLDASAPIQVLIVEDHPLNAMLLQDILVHWGYKAHHVADGQQAITWLETQKADLILLDIQLPGMDGFEIAYQIRANPAWQEIPIIAITALAMAGDRERCLAAGLHDYISKPLNYEELATVLTKYTGKCPTLP
ncbi:MAG: PAS domain S-box protein [Scytolyngbya sp. HA4215-MV1]|jgi:PAS domain S-box-containing protein|nr:PAS domain S-box protein [Scytolyngbya sp. HA4215-MV1]